MKDEKVEQSFISIAEDLLQNYLLSINDTIIQLTDIEFYYFSDMHKDGFTLIEPRKNKGEFRPHRYGIDISLGEGSSYGGILLKGCFTKDQYFYKSNKVGKIVLDCLQFGDNKIAFIPGKAEHPIFQTIRSNLGKLNIAKHRTEEFFEKKYRFILQDHGYYKAITGNKKELIKHSTLSAEQVKIFQGRTGQ